MPVPPQFDAAFLTRLDTLFAWRRDVRRFRRDPLPAGLLEHLIAQACLAPSVGLSQPARFVIVQDEGRRDAVRAAFESANRTALADYVGERHADYARLKLAGLREAPCHLAVFADETTSAGHGLGRRTMPEMLRYSAVAAIVQLWLAARAHGVGLGWVSILDPVAVTRVLDVPDGWALIGYLCLGWPCEASDEPELARKGWEARQPPQALTVRR